MGQQTVSGQFRQSAINVSVPILQACIGMNFFDTVGTTNPNATAWSSGTEVIDVLPIQPPLGQTWAITNWAIAANLYLFYPFTTGGAQHLGALGTVYGGLVKGEQQTSQPINPGNFAVPWDFFFSALPQDLSMVAPIFDGGSQPAPPNIVNSQSPFFPAANVPIQFMRPYLGSQQVPVPLQLQAGEQASIGMWIPPRLSNFGLAALFSTYTVTYDDGQQPQGGWGGG